MINFFDSAYGDSAPICEKSYVLESICHYGGLTVCDSDSFDAVKKKINTYLDSQEKRFEGLVLLRTVVDQCHVDMLQKNVLIWVQKLLKVLQCHGESSGSCKLAYKILKQMLRCLWNYPHLKREASASLLPTLLDTLLELSIEDEWIEQAAECLSACIKYFPATCGLKKDKIEEFLILLLDRWELKEFEPIAECFAHLPACGVDGNDKSSSFQRMWGEQFQQFIGVQNAILNFLYDGVENGHGDLKICSAKQLPPVPEEPRSKVLKLVHRFKSFGLCLSKMLVSASHYRVVVPVDTLLVLLNRILSMCPSHMERNALIYAVLPSLYLTALTILEAFILSCDQHVMPVCHLVSRLLTQVLKSSSLKNSSSTYCLNLVRCAAYQVLRLYSEKFKLFNIADNHRELLVSVMISDTATCMTEFDGASNPAVASHAVEASDSRKYRNHCRTSTEAVKALNSFVTYGNLDYEQYKDIYTCAVNTILEIQDKPVGLRFPCCDERYRLALYSLLQTLLLNFSPQDCTIWPHFIYIATNGLEDLSAAVRNKCQEILNTADVFVNMDKRRIPGLPSVQGKSEEKMTLAGQQTYNQIGSTSDSMFPVKHHVMSSEQHSIANETSSCAEIVNGVLPAASVSENPPSQIVDNNKSFHSEHSQEPHRTDSAEIATHDEDNDIGEPVFYNSNAYSASEPEMEDEEEMDVEEEEEDEYKESYVNHNGYSSEDECVSEEEEEVSPSKRLSSSDVQSNGPSPKKEVHLNDAEENSDPDVSMMLQDFNPTSPDPES